METIDYKNPRLVVESKEVLEGRVAWRSPSNLALIKYWGKHGNQLPRNPSVSFTLQAAYTSTQLAYQAKEKSAKSNEIDLRFFFQGQPAEVFAAKVRDYLFSLKDIFPFLLQLELTIHSENSFPHSAGIASSASAMSALALCLCDLERKLFGGLENEEDFSRKASYLARLGSGSACRSIYPLAAVWGATSDLPGSSDLFALPYGDQLHQVFRSYQNAILIVGKGEKSISSRTGHHLMDDNEYAESRYQQARRRMSRMLGALSAGDLESFGAVVESEALTLHALMMASYPPYILLKPNTITLIEKVRQFRLDTKTPLYFSLDAGPNPHLLYPENEKSKVETFIENELKPYCEDQRWIADRVGEGPQKM